MTKLAESDCDAYIIQTDTLPFLVHTQGADKAESGESSLQEAVGAAAAGAIVRRA